MIEREKRAKPLVSVCDLRWLFLSLCLLRLCQVSALAALCLLCSLLTKFTCYDTKCQDCTLIRFVALALRIHTFQLRQTVKNPKFMTTAGHIAIVGYKWDVWSVSHVMLQCWLLKTSCACILYLWKETVIPHARCKVCAIRILFSLLASERVWFALN